MGAEWIESEVYRKHTFCEMRQKMSLSQPLFDIISIRGSEKINLDHFPLLDFQQSDTKDEKRGNVNTGFPPFICFSLLI